MYNSSFSLNAADSTDWQLKPSFKYDLLCFVNILTGDEFYLTYYKSEYDRFKDQLTPEVKDALKSLKKKIKDDEGTIISAWLCLYFSSAEDETIDEMTLTLDNPQTMKSNFEKTPYYSDKSWQMFLSVIPELKTILDFLKDIGFPDYWEGNILPKVQSKISEFKSDVSKYNVIGITEEHLGFKLESNRITVYMLFYSQPHGIKITGTRFLTDIAWPFSILIRTASHEMMHPPFDLKNDSVLIGTLSKLKNETFLMDKVLNHNPSFGYNSFEGFVEEDCVQSLDQIINEKLGISRDPRKRWEENDDGMHVLAIALYNIMKEENYNEEKMIYRDFIIRNIENGKLLNGNIEKIYNNFYRPSDR